MILLSWKKKHAEDLDIVDNGHQRGWLRDKLNKIKIKIKLETRRKATSKGIAEHHKIRLSSISQVFEILNPNVPSFL